MARDSRERYQLQFICNSSDCTTYVMFSRFYLTSFGLRFSQLQLSDPLLDFVSH